ncbi:hypothetical protein Tco_1070056 [Tanacetum coccineum]|uniref:RNA-directed DNA polymerase, eukaryota n=1 Tax=Tanacetum coccineum TaxID=301880 RepID=A0ABQ5HLF2_9ASTR
MQKAKVRWAIEGDENSKYFHAIINKKRANLSVKGVMVDGDWVVDPILVKKEFRDHFADRFQDPGPRKGRINFQFPNRLSSEQVADLETRISTDEIRSAVWGCGVDKSPGPDGFTFDFFRKYWTVVGTDFCSAVLWFFDHGELAVGILERGLFIINEVLARCKVKKQQAMIFKVDFAKAYDSIRWDFLEDVLTSFGFGPQWCSWIRGSLMYGMLKMYFELHLSYVDWFLRFDNYDGWLCGSSSIGLGSNQDYNYSQDYSMGHGSGHGSAHGSAHGSVPIHDDEDDSPVEEVSPVKPKKPSRRAARAKKDDPRELPKDWTVAEETALCQAYCDVSENNINENSMKAKGFWDAVIRYFENEIGSSRGYDSIVSK